ncbi:MAG: hypothetical protein MJA84_07595, partial [Firmicutes bacterium]|nr:hypothetical protein [Bacillota bacterium]
VLAIPFATGDLDLSGSGTVTDVLPDGRVLAFGHAMDGIGDRALPMYTGYVHYVVPLRSISFKLSGSLAPAGSVIRDEQSAVGGLSETRYGTAPVKVRVKLPNQDEQVYKYQVLEDQPITPGIMAAVVGQSVGAVQQLPRENTLRMKGKLRFEGSREIELDVIQARATSQAVAASVAPVGAALMNNPFERIKLESAEIEVEVEPKSRIASISDIWIDRTQVAPGESVGINVEFRRLRGETFIKRIEFEIPEDADEGDYQLTIGDAATYVQRLTGTHPHYSRARNVDQLARAIQRLNAFRSDAVYLMLTMPETTGLAVGTQELPDLPSSRVALLTGQAGSRVTPYADLEEKIVPMDDVISGSLEMVINVRDPYATTPKADAAE